MCNHAKVVSFCLSYVDLFVCQVLIIFPSAYSMSLAVYYYILHMSQKRTIQAQSSNICFRMAKFPSEVFWLVGFKHLMVAILCQINVVWTS